MRLFPSLCVLTHILRRTQYYELLLYEEFKKIMPKYIRNLNVGTFVGIYLNTLVTQSIKQIKTVKIVY